ncbi:MAG: septum site-determining protein MinC [Nitrosomonas sp.]|nr:septum site-determining protein MinC [Nitrosomonas sp.]
MSIDPQRKSYTPPVLEFKSSTFFVPVLILYSHDVHLIEQSLHEKISQAPDFFKNSPLIFDVQGLNKENNEFDVAALIEILRKIGLFPIGIRGGNEQQNDQAQALFIPVDAVRSNESVETQESAAANIEPEPETTESPPKADMAVAAPIAVPTPTTIPTTLISHPIRSGQRIYAAGDLIVMSPVSAGAEIMAEGNIHVYNTLRGRALAGVQGNKKSRIFCSDLQAELISIAGDYKTSEDLNDNVRKKPVQIYLQDRALIIKDIA